MTAAQRVSTGYAPRIHQALEHAKLKRFNVLVAHRRFGKTVFCINETIDQALRCGKERPRYGYIAPFRNQAKQVAWDYLKAYTRPIPTTTFNEAELRADLPGDRRIQLFGADNADALRGLYFDGVIFDEYAQMEPRVWSEIVRPALSDREGWAIFIGTPMGRNHFCELYEGAQEGWHTALFKASETGILAKEELDAARRAMTDEQYRQEFECSFTAAIVGAYYGKDIEAAENEDRVTSVPYERSAKVVTAWDLGWDDATSIWFAQQVGKEIRLIDHYEASGEALDHYAKVLAEKPYAYARHLLPHDAEQHELISGRSRVEALRSLGIEPTVVKRHKPEDGINAVRLLLPKCLFDKKKCARGLEALKQYRREWDDKAKTWRSRPLHDWTSHAADAFRYLAVGWSEENPMPAAWKKRSRAWIR